VRTAPDPPEPERTEPERSAQRTLPETKPEPALEVADLALCRRVKGFGDVEPWGAASPKGGQAVLIYGTLNNIRFEPDGDGVRSKLAATLDVLAAEGDRPLWSRTLKVAEDRCQTPRREYFVVYRVVLPDFVPPGSYRLRLRARDLVAGQDAERTIPLTLAR
jgi:hypothetical protein